MGIDITNHAVNAKVMSLIDASIAEIVYDFDAGCLRRDCGANFWDGADKLRRKNGCSGIVRHALIWHIIGSELALVFSRPHSPERRTSRSPAFPAQS